MRTDGQTGTVQLTFAILQIAADAPEARQYELHAIALHPTDIQCQYGNQLLPCSDFLCYGTAQPEKEVSTFRNKLLLKSSRSEDQVTSAHCDSIGLKPLQHTETILG
jgi:hypothetical protein